MDNGARSHWPMPRMLMTGGEFTGHVFDELRLRDTLRIEGPHGNFYLRDSSNSANNANSDPQRPIIMVAGGTGFAPVKSMVEHAIHRNLKRPITIYWGARRPEGLYMHELVLEWTSRHDNIRYIPVISEVLPQDNWRGRTGMVHQAVLADYPDLSASDVYLCGSEQMTVTARQNFAQHGLTEEHLYCDVFCSSREVAFIA
jgi:CDP-4-dehydro-6-deoxyglucose reductase, E3